jgi:hypothetical protein
VYIYIYIYIYIIQLILLPRYSDNFEIKVWFLLEKSGNVFFFLPRFYLEREERNKSNFTFFFPERLRDVAVIVYILHQRPNQWVSSY